MIPKVLAKIGTLRRPRPAVPPLDGAMMRRADPAPNGLASALNGDTYLSLADPELRLISVFDDLTYDRADIDILTGPMRRYAVTKLSQLGFKQVSGTTIEDHTGDIRVLIPKIHALGASPFDAARYLARRPQDFVLLTPTQAACQMIDRYPCEEAMERIKTLIRKHPINLLKITDHLEHKDAHRVFRGSIGHLKFVQRTAIESDPLRGRRAL